MHGRIQHETVAFKSSKALQLHKPLYMCCTPYSPNRLSAASTLFGLFVAAMTITCARCLRPSMSVSSWETIRLSTSPCVYNINFSFSMNSPNLLKAASILFGLLVAAIIITWARCLRPSIKVSNWDTILRSTSPWVYRNTVTNRFLYRRFRKHLEIRDLIAW